MEEHHQKVYRNEEEFKTTQYIDRIRPHWWKIIGISLLMGIITLLSLCLQPNIYRATAIIAPEEEEGKMNAAFGALAAFGISIGNPTKVEDLEALFKSYDLTVRVFRKYNLWPIVFPGKIDLEKGMLKVGWLENLFGKKGDFRNPTDWDAIRTGEKNLTISTNRKLGTVSISFDSFSPVESANIVRHYLDESKSRLQEEAFEKANNNKLFIKKQIENTIDTLTRDRLYTLYGQEIEKEMMALNRNQFGFIIIDSPRAPDKSIKPHRVVGSISAIIFTFVTLCIYYSKIYKSY